MAVRLRLMRTGKKKQPTYRVVAADSRSPRDGRFIEIVGTYQPRLEPSGIIIDNEKALKWLRNGAQPTAQQVAKWWGRTQMFRWEPSGVSCIFPSRTGPARLPNGLRTRTLNAEGEVDPVRASVDFPLVG